MNRSILGKFFVIMLFAVAQSAYATTAVIKEPVMEGPPVAGVVHDSMNMPLPNVHVVITQLNRTTTTDAQGHFVFTRLAPGNYLVYASLVGYAPGRIQLNVPTEGDTVRLNITLRRSVLELSAVHVTATPTASDALNITQSTVDLSGQTLQKNLGASVAQTLVSQPGLAMRYNGPAANAPIIRGLSGDRVLVLQNGERASDLSSAAPDHVVTVDPLNATSVEVVRGPASLMYGNNALGGVVNVLSTDIPNSVPNHLEGSFATQGETVNNGGAVAAVVTLPVASNFAVSARGSYRGAGDTRMGSKGLSGNGGDLLNSFLHQSGGTIGAGYVGDGRTAGFSFEAQQFNYGLPGDVSDPEFGIHIKGNRQQATAKADMSFSGSYFKQIHFDGTGQWYKHDEVENTGDVGTSFNLKTQTASAMVKTAFGPLTGAVGLSSLFKQYDVSGEEALTPAANSNSIGAFVYQEVPLGFTTLQTGVRYDTYHIKTKDSDDPRFGTGHSVNFNNVSGSLGLVVPVATGITVNGNVSRAFRAPTVEELFANGEHAALGTFDIGNPNLKVETNTGGELVLRAQRGRVHAQLSGYFNRIDNYVAVDIVGDTVTDAGDTIPLNLIAQRDAKLRGAEGDIEGQVLPHIVVGAMGDIVRGDFVGGGNELVLLPEAVRSKPEHCFPSS